MSFAVAAYAITLGTLVGYAGLLLRERRRLAEGGDD